MDFMKAVNAMSGEVSADESYVVNMSGYEQSSSVAYGEFTEATRNAVMKDFSRFINAYDNNSSECASGLENVIHWTVLNDLKSIADVKDIIIKYSNLVIHMRILFDCEDTMGNHWSRIGFDNYTTELNGDNVNIHYERFSSDGGVEYWRYMITSA